MPDYRVFKETVLPAELVANGIYFVAPAARPDFVEIYVTNQAGTATRRVIDQAMVQAMIDTAIAAGSGGAVIVDDIAARDALEPANAQQVLVIDASGDETVTAGSATYVWREATSAWIKTSEAESMDLTLSWDALTGRPDSSAAQIDAAVSASHSHENKTELDLIGEDEDQNLTYRGQRPRTVWDSTGW